MRPEQAVLELHREDRLAARTRLEPGGRSRLPDLEVGRYVLRSKARLGSRPIELSRRGEVVVNLDAAPTRRRHQPQRIRGRTRAVGAVVMLVRHADRAE